MVLLEPWCDFGMVWSSCYDMLKVGMIFGSVLIISLYVFHVA